MRTPAGKQLMRFLPVRAGNILVELHDLAQALALTSSLEREPISGVREFIPAARTILVAFDPKLITERELITQISQRDIETSDRSLGPLIEIPVAYDGEDLSAVATLLGVSEAEIVRRHTGTEYQVAFTGFAPGFAYLAGGDPRLSVPRHRTPRTHVPAGSVGLAGEFSGVYPKDSPGGWQLIGSTPLKMFNLEQDPAALLRPGNRVRFADISRVGPPVTLSTEGPSIKKRRSTAQARARIEILSTMLPILFEDMGRPWQSTQGVSISGAADKASLQIANRLVGNEPGKPGLEITFGQVQFRTTGNVFAAIAGAPVPIQITAVDGRVRKAGHLELMAIERGETVSIGSPSSGIRSYLAVRGGFDVEPVVGSASRDMLAQIGPEPLLAGASAGILAPPARAVVSAGEHDPFAMPAKGQTVTIDVTLGPRSDWFTPESVERFLSQVWNVSPQSSRVGIRLLGEALERIDQNELPSEATLQGAIQVPASGQPVLFLVDHPLTGGYPVIANVAAHHLDLAGQLPPGSKVRFQASR